MDTEPKAGTDKAAQDAPRGDGPPLPPPAEGVPATSAPVPAPVDGPLAPIVGSPASAEEPPAPAEGLLASVESVRTPILWYGLAFLVASSLSWPLAKWSFGALSRLAGRPLVAYSPSEPLLALISLSGGFGLALSFPIAAHLAVRLLSSRFPKAFPRNTALVVPAATILFLSGGALAWFLLLPAGVTFLVSFESPEAKALLSIRAFVSFCTTFVVALGLAFQAPLVSLLLGRAGILSPAIFRKSWRMAILGCTILSAVLTPTPDVYNMALMAVPLLGLYMASFLVVVLFGKTKGGDAPPAGEGSGDDTGGDGPTAGAPGTTRHGEGGGKV